MIHSHTRTHCLCIICHVLKTNDIINDCEQTTLPSIKEKHALSIRGQLSHDNIGGSILLPSLQQQDNYPGRWGYPNHPPSPPCWSYKPTILDFHHNNNWSEGTLSTGQGSKRVSWSNKENQMMCWCFLDYQELKWCNR